MNININRVKIFVTVSLQNVEEVLTFLFIK